ncbi:MAG: hypothetical protein ACR2F6_01975 [Mycobacteriales bacterium]
MTILHIVGRCRAWVAPAHFVGGSLAHRAGRADVAYPVILSSEGRLMDGGHRIARAFIDGRTEIAAVKFETDPEPHYLVATP